MGLSNRRAEYQQRQQDRWVTSGAVQLFDV